MAVPLPPSGCPKLPFPTRRSSRGSVVPTGSLRAKADAEAKTAAQAEADVEKDREMMAKAAATARQKLDDEAKSAVSRGGSGRCLSLGVDGAAGGGLRSGGSSAAA